MIDQRGQRGQLDLLCQDHPNELVKLLAVSAKAVFGWRDRFVQRGTAFSGKRAFLQC